MIELLTENHMDKLLDLFEGTKKNIKIISPFLTMSMAERLCAAKETRHVECSFITRFYMEDMIAKANSIDALRVMLEKGVSVYAVKRLHTKLYLFDENSAIVGSANFTNGGFKSNLELSLHISYEPPLLEELHFYFDDLQSQLEQLKDGIVTHAMLNEAQSLYASLFSSKKASGTSKTRSIKMFGAALSKRDDLQKTEDAIKEIDLCMTEKDIVHDIFRLYEQAEQIKYPFTIWLKFDGEGNDRLNAEELFPMTDFRTEQGTIFLSNYPFKVPSVKDNDEIYFAALTTDRKGKNQPIIVGKGHLAAFTEENEASSDMLQKYPWMSRYPWYCIIKDSEVLNTTVNNGIPMDLLWDVLGSDTYVASYGKNEDIASVARKHYQKAHIRLSGNAKQLIDEKFSMLKDKYGVVRYISNLP